MPKPILTRAASRDMEMSGSGRNSPISSATSSIGHKLINILLAGKKQNSLSSENSSSGSSTSSEYEKTMSQFGLMSLKQTSNESKNLEDDGGVYKGPDM